MFSSSKPRPTVLTLVPTANTALNVQIVWNPTSISKSPTPISISKVLQDVVYVDIYGPIQVNNFWGHPISTYLFTLNLGISSCIWCSRNVMWSRLFGPLNARLKNSIRLLSRSCTLMVGVNSSKRTSKHGSLPLFILPPPHILPIWIAVAKFGIGLLYNQILPCY